MSPMHRPPVRGQPAGANRPVMAVILLVAATLCFASQDALTKHLVQTLPVPQIVAVRYFFFALFALGYVYRQTGGFTAAFASRRPGLQVFRALLIAAEITVFAYAIGFLGLAEIHAIMACFPLLATALSVPILGESVGWRRWLAVFVGFIGTLIILRPGSAVFQPATAIALTSALMFALYNVLTRKVAGDDSFATSLLYVGVVGFLGAAVFAPFHWHPVNPAEAAWLLLISCTSIIGHLLLIKALALAPAVVLQPFHYFMLVWATLIAFLVYGEVLSAATLLGAAIVVGSGVFIAWREYKLHARAP